MKILKKNKYTFLINIAKYSFIIFFVISFLSPIPPVVSACANPPCSESSTTPGLGSSTTPGLGSSTTPGLGSSTSTQINTGINNPLNSSIKDIPSFIKLVLQSVIYIGVPIVTLAIIYSGFLFVQAQGNEEQLTKAKKTLMYTLIGAALLLGSLVITDAIKGTVDEIKRTSQ